MTKQVFDVSAEICLSVVCSECGKSLSVTMRNNELEVEPCTRCSETNEDLQYEAGKKAGYNEGHRDGYDEGYDEGVKAA